MYTENEISKIILDIAFDIHTKLGPGLFESVYEEILSYELEDYGLSIKKQQGIPVIWNELRLEVGFRADIIVEDKVIVEIKAVEALNDVHTAQVLTYLKLSGCKVGLLLNFHTSSLKNGIKRLMY